MSFNDFYLWAGFIKRPPAFAGASSGKAREFEESAERSVAKFEE